jgi:hypothetical protein
MVAPRYFLLPGNFWQTISLQKKMGAAKLRRARKTTFMN